MPTFNEFGIIPVARGLQGKLLVQKEIAFSSAEEAKRAGQIFAEVLGGSSRLSSPGRPGGRHSRTGGDHRSLRGHGRQSGRALSPTRTTPAISMDVPPPHSISMSSLPSQGYDAGGIRDKRHHSPCRHVVQRVHNVGGIVAFNDCRGRVV